MAPSPSRTFLSRNPIVPEDFGEAPKSARESACAPQASVTSFVIRASSFHSRLCRRRRKLRLSSIQLIRAISTIGVFSKKAALANKTSPVCGKSTCPRIKLRDAPSRNGRRLSTDPGHLCEKASLRKGSSAETASLAKIARASSRSEFAQTKTAIRSTSAWQAFYACATSLARVCAPPPAWRARICRRGRQPCPRGWA